jgi:hypothetical protein
MEKKVLLDEMIEKYRVLVSERYEFDSLEAKFILDESVTPELINKVKLYFLDYIYPSKDQREILNDAFDDLDKHIKNPGQLLKLLGDAPGIIFNFGWQFPKALKAGFQALKSFKAASRFEKELVAIAKKKKVKLPISDELFEEILADLPQDELRDFISEMEDLLSALTDSKLLKKTTAILTELIKKMNEQKDFFSDEEINALKIGIDILDNGYNLFDNMSEAEKREMIELIIKAENDFLEDLDEKYHQNR